MKRKVFSLMFPLFYSIIPALLYVLLNFVNLDIRVIKFSLLVFFVNLGWISFIHLYGKNEKIILILYMIISVIFSSYFVFFSLENSYQYKIIFALLIIGFLGLSLFIKIKKRKIGDKI
jgi:hypothetical protein